MNHEIITGTYDNKKQAIMFEKELRLVNAIILGTFNRNSPIHHQRVNKCKTKAMNSPAFFLMH